MITPTNGLVVTKVPTSFESRSPIPYRVIYHGKSGQALWLKHLSTGLQPSMSRWDVDKPSVVRWRVPELICEEHNSINT